MKALILVDIQNDFLPSGALPVPKGDEVVPVANCLQRVFELVVERHRQHGRIAGLAVGFLEPEEVVVLATDNHARSDLPADRFNEYLRAEGLTPALAVRERTGRPGSLLRRSGIVCSLALSVATSVRWFIAK